MAGRGRYARLLARSRRGDGAAGALVGLIVAAVMYLLLFGALMVVTSEQDDTTGIEYRLLADRAEASLNLMLSSAGEGGNVTNNPQFLGAPDAWTRHSATTTRETKDGTSALKVVKSGGGVALTSDPSAIRKETEYVVRATLHGSASVNVLWYKDEDARNGGGQPLRTDTAAVSSSGNAWATHTSAALVAPSTATVVLLEVAGSTFWAERVALEVKNSKAWEAAPDGLIRFGLLEENLEAYPGFSAPRLPNVLDYTKMAALRKGEMVSRNNGGADYPTVRDSLGLDKYQFHLRAHPVFNKLGGSFEMDAAVELAYLGHYTTEPADSTVTSTAVRYDNPVSPSWVAFDLEVYNAGDSAMPFRITTTLTPPPGTQQASVVEDNLHTPEIPSEGRSTVTYRVYGVGNQAAWKLGSSLKVSLADAFSNKVHEITIPFTTPANGAGYNIKVEPGSPYFLSTESPQIFLDHFDGSGKRLNSGPKIDVEILKPSGASAAFWGGLALPKNKATSETCTTCTDLGAYTVRARPENDPTWMVVETFVVRSEAPEQSSEQHESSATESSILTELAASYTDTVDRTAGCPGDDLVGQPGDKYRDSKTGTEALVDRLLKADGSLCYHILVVGSNVRHTAMTSAKVKYGIADWVYAGGTLVVLGSTDQSVQWMQPLSGTGLRAASGGIGAPDPTHPILNSPERLAYESYRDPGTVWELKKGDEEDYTHVLVRSQEPAASNDMLAVSKPGLFGDGTVILSAYMPYDLLPGSGEEERAEAKRFLHNMVTQAYAGITVDFGPPVPPGVQVASATRLTIVPHPLVPGALLEVRVTLYVFP